MFLSLADRDKSAGVTAARLFVELGLSIAATAGTARHLEDHGIEVVTVVAKLGEQTGTDAVELISSGKVDLVVNSPRGRGPRADGAHIRAAAGANGVPLLHDGLGRPGRGPGHGRLVRGTSSRCGGLQEYHRGVRDDQLSFPL